MFTDSHVMSQARTNVVPRGRKSDINAKLSLVRDLTMKFNV